MTTAKKMFRQRRSTSLSAIPRNIQQWFSGERRFTFYAYTYPFQAHLKEYWEAWLEEHPGAKMPDNLEYLIKSAMGPEKMKEREKSLE